MKKEYSCFFDKTLMGDNNDFCGTPLSCDDGKTVEHQLTDHEIARFLKVNDLNTGQLLKAVGPHIVKRQFYYRGAVGNLESDQLPDGGVQQPLVGGGTLGRQCCQISTGHCR